jgi:hypothetical protein
MDPIVSLHYYAPVCAVINVFIIPFTEGLEPFYALHKVGLLVLFTNAGVAFALNVSFFIRTCFRADVQVAAVFLISVGSGLILTLAGVAKDIVSWRIQRESGELMYSSSSLDPSLLSDLPSPHYKSLVTPSLYLVWSCSRPPVESRLLVPQLVSLPQ